VLGGGDLGTMTAVTRKDLSHLTDHEISVLLRHLVARARQAPP
jgi:hypothetical protein